MIQDMNFTEFILFCDKSVNYWTQLEPTLNIAAFVDHHIKDISRQHHSYLQDTPDFLRYVEKINSGPALKYNHIIVTWDVEGLYNNIIHEEGLQSREEGLNERKNPDIANPRRG